MTGLRPLRTARTGDLTVGVMYDEKHVLTVRRRASFTATFGETLCGKKGPAREASSETMWCVKCKREIEAWMSI
jgi:hypothetical protein